MAPARAWLADRGGEPEGVRAAGEDARYGMATAAERREMPDAVLTRNGNAQLVYDRQAERWPTAPAATAAATTFAGSTVAAGSVAVPASALLGLAQTAAGLAQLALAGLTITPTALAVLAAAAAAGAVIYLLQRQHRSLVDQGALPAAPTDRANSIGYDMMGNPTGMPDPSWSGDEPRVLAPLPGFGDGLKAPTFQEKFSPAPALPQSTATPTPERLIDPVEKLVPPQIDPALVFDNRSVEDFREKLDRQLDHLNPSHLDAARQERANRIVAVKKSGIPFNHVREVAETTDGIIKLTESLKRRLSHPDLTDADRSAITSLLSEASRKVEEVRRMVPGIDEETGKRE